MANEKKNNMARCFNCFVPWSHCDPGKCLAANGVCFGCGGALQENDDHMCEECRQVAQDDWYARSGGCSCDVEMVK